MIVYFFFDFGTAKKINLKYYEIKIEGTAFSKI
ncbi:hypothetical protein UC3_02646 [Enterococcus phoeniculicola ATCC BAA-412]|uniref:Uncharacterized protein n=1 Tax=Enterococcus phoeniculicola ATCC BAA-412 TaxID=1158610 RepID=R3TLE9_9ENTE|nr:hypothetical protein UC3_02646 [Enterococcus phoeniculicola ATCC BAA-412]EOT79427.1 hypothetical protein I589_00935 [Enterococcus phoeniculicola ATCC BAA-412]